MLYYYINIFGVHPTIIIMIRSTSLDKFGIFLSGLCIVHCLITPIAITLIPILTLNSFIEDVLFHKLMLWLVLPTSCIALFIGCRKHRDWLIGSTGVVGMLILVVIAFFGHDLLSSTGERIGTSIGGIVLAVSHILNYRACQKRICPSKNCETVHHH